MVEMVPCPACGGAGGGPFGPAGSAWDDEDYVCARCEGKGTVLEGQERPRPGLVKAEPPAPAQKRKATG